MKTWQKVTLIAVPSLLVTLSLVTYGCYIVAEKAVNGFSKQVVDPKFAASVTRTMISISDPPPANFAYQWAIDVNFTKVVVLARGEHFIILVQAKESSLKRQLSLKQSMAEFGPAAPLKSDSFKGETAGEMNVGNGTLQYELGRFNAGEGSGFDGMLGLLRNGNGQPRVLIESFDRSESHFDFGITKNFLKGITEIR